jgi:heterodisulfide reductase subunit B
MNMGYYPGCSLHGTARDYNDSILEICNALGISLNEIPDWNCCGASSAHMTNHEVAMRLSIRNLLQVKDRKLDILIPCSACYQRLKTADKALRENPEFWDVGNYEMPTTLETIVAAVGAAPVSWSHRTECCSGSLTMTRPDIAGKLVGDIVAAARRAGATALVTDCPMCQANVESRQIDIAPEGPHLPVYYATELIAAALSGEYTPKQQKAHLVPASALQNHLAGANLNREESP